jgi:hypothetical protein
MVERLYLPVNIHHASIPATGKSLLIALFEPLSGPQGLLYRFCRFANFSLYPAHKVSFIAACTAARILKNTLYMLFGSSTNNNHIVNGACI